MALQTAYKLCRVPSIAVSRIVQYGLKMTQLSMKRSCGIFDELSKALHNRRALWTVHYAPLRIAVQRRNFHLIRNCNEMCSFDLIVRPQSFFRWSPWNVDKNCRLSSQPTTRLVFYESVSFEAKKCHCCRSERDSDTGCPRIKISNLLIMRFYWDINPRVRMLHVIKVECLITGGCVQSIGKMCEMLKNSKK